MQMHPGEANVEKTYNCSKVLPKFNTIPLSLGQLSAMRNDLRTRFIMAPLT